MRRVVLSGLVVVLCHCSSYDSANDTTQSDAGGGSDAGAGDEGGGGGSGLDAGGSDANSNPPPDCDPTADPKAPIACVSDDFGLFVEAVLQGRCGACTATAAVRASTAGRAVVQGGGVMRGGASPPSGAGTRVYACACET